MGGEVTVRRALAAVRFMDYPTGRPVVAPMRVVAEGTRWVHSQSGAWVLLGAPGLEAHTTSFEAPPSTPPVGSVTVDVVATEPTGTYLPRAFSIALPRPVGNGPDDLSTPVEVYLPPSPGAFLRRTWAAVRVHVRLAPDADHPSGTPVEGALVRLEVPGEGVRCMSLTDPRGEALVIGHGIPRFSAGDDDDIVASTLDHDVTTVVDPAVTDASTGRRASVADPDDLWARRNSLRLASTTLSLAPGDEHHLVFDIPRS